MVYQKSITLGVLCGVCVGAIAAPTQDHLSAEVAVESVVTDNARRVASNEINERQDTVTIGLRGQQTNRYSSFKIGYSVEKTFFSENTQEEDNRYQGDAVLELGKDYDWFGLVLQDSQRRVLNASNSTALLQNTSDREIISVKPQLRAHFTPVDTLILGISRESVRLKRSQELDSDRDSADVLWQHRLSAVDLLMLSIAQGESTRDTSSEPDYEYQIARIGFQARLSRLGYGAYVGYQKTEAAGQPSFNEPNYQVDLNYDGGGHRFVLGLSSRITDTLFGDENGAALEDSLSQDSLSQNYDLIKLTEANFNWATPAIWRSLQLELQAQYSGNDYVTLAEDFTDKGVSISFSYRLAPRTHSSLRLERIETTYEPSLLDRDFNEDRAMARIGHDFTRSLNAQLRYGIVKRNSSAAENEFTEQRVGISVRYQF